MTRALRIVLCGADGRMGRQVRLLAKRDRRFASPIAVTRKNKADFPALAARADVVVDFTNAPASLRFAAVAASLRKPIVLGATGWTPAQRRALERLSRKTAVFLSPNFSVGMNVALELAAQASRALPAYKAAIEETHHIHKKDKPSGTALRLAQALNRKKVSIKSIRRGEVVGEHVLRLSGPFEGLELRHSARSRAVFAAGALEAARWLARKRPGFYDMRDLIAQ